MAAAPAQPAGKPDLFAYEQQAWASGCGRVAGIDEVGRGPLAGPVVAVAVILPRDCQLPYLADSKTLTEKQRQLIAAELLALPGIEIGVGQIAAAEIDRHNILNATHLAMAVAVRKLAPPPDFALIDGLPVPSFPIAARAIVKGDRKSASIAAASILAKVWRDQLMLAFDAVHPGYNFARHKGYGTAEHLAALRQLGASPIHRRSFAPVAQVLPGAPQQLQFAF